MSVIMENAYSFKLNSSYNKFQKCGEIKSSADGKEFGLNCVFCKDIFLKLDVFIVHIQTNHLREVLELFEERYASENASYKDTKSEEFAEVTINPTNFRSSEIDALLTEDPLGESLQNEVPEKLQESDISVCDNIDIVVKKGSPFDMADNLEGGYNKKTDSMNSDTTLGNNRYLLPSVKNHHADICSIDKTKENSSMIPMNNEQLGIIAEIYKQHPCLWDFDHEDNADSFRKREARAHMLQQVSEKLNIKPTPADLKVSISRLRRLYAVEKQLRLQAEKANKPFRHNSKLYNLMQFLQHSIGPYKCEKCLELFSSHEKYRRHMAEHDGDMPFKCKICNKGIRKIGNLRVHMRRHYGIAKFLCTECGKGFPTSSDLNKHLNTHSEVCEFSCDQCGLSFSRLSFLKSHKAKHDSNTAHKCTICSKAFHQMYKYKEHMNSHLNKRICICDICNRGFFSRKTLAQHKKIHSEKKDYTCPICRKDYARPASFYRHMEIQHSMDKKEYQIKTFAVANGKQSE